MKCASWQFLLLLVFTGVVRTEKPVVYHTEEINGQIEVVQGGEGLFPATATYSDDVATTGWATLSIEGNDEFPEVLQAFSAGYLEGHLTQHRIFEAQSNMFAHAFGGAGPGPNVTRFFEEQLAFVRHLIVTEHDAYATSLALVMSQFEGLYRGYVSAAPANESLTELELYMHNAAGDLEDLATVLGEAHQPLTLASRNNGLSAVDFLDCSALLVLGKDDAFAGHTTWRDYGNMSPRTYKWVRLSGRTVGYSSTPGFLSSKDDFYTVTSPRHNVSLSVIETTNAIFNTSLYDRLTPRSVFTWQRTMIANKIASNGDEWTEAFGHLNSGTYNNQWMVLDYTKLGERTESGAAPTGSLWILEQIPGYVQRGDVTAVLNKQKYWASYNIPFFVDVYNMSGYNTQPGTDNSYQHCPRANIFRQRAGNVTDVAALQFIMQYNDYEHDPLSSHNPMNAISSRADLLSQPLAEPKAFGGIDSKVTSGRLIADDRAMATSGPTQQQKPFVWSHTRFKTMHQGQPDAFDFPWRAVSPTWQESME